MPSKEAMELAGKIGRVYSRVEQEGLAELLDTALAKARLDLADPQRVAEWWNSGNPAKPANQAFTAGPERQMAYMLEEARLEGVKAMQEANIEAARSVHSDDAVHAIGKLDPQQVINESMGK